MTTRRSILTTVGIAVATAGCAGALGESGEDTYPPGTVYLGELHVQNNNLRDHTIQLAIEADGEIIHMDTYELDRQSSRIVPGEWEESPAAYRLHAKLDEDDVVTADVTDGVSDDVDCVRVLVRVDEDGRLGVWNGAGCDNGEDPLDSD